MTNTFDRYLLEAVAEWVKKGISDDEDYMETLRTWPVDDLTRANMRVHELYRLTEVLSVLLDSGFRDSSDTEMANKILGVVTKRRKIFDMFINSAKRHNELMHLLEEVDYDI